MNVYVNGVRQYCKCTPITLMYDKILESVFRQWTMTKSVGELVRQADLQCRYYSFFMRYIFISL